jgi:hypothetical protein
VIDSLGKAFYKKTVSPDFIGCEPIRYVAAQRHRRRAAAESGG